MSRGIYIVALVKDTKNLLLQYEDIYNTTHRAVGNTTYLTDLPVYFSCRSSLWIHAATIKASATAVCTYVVYTRHMSGEFPQGRFLRSGNNLWFYTSGGIDI